MKKVLIPLFFLCSVGMVFAQETANNDKPKPEKPALRNEIGITIWGNNPYTVSYRAYGAKRAFRAGINLNSLFNSASNAFTSNFNGGIRLGVQWQKEIHPKWWVFYGVDLHPALQVSRSENDVSLRTDQWTRTELSAGPLFGFMYRINPRFAVSTEGNIFGTYWMENSKVITSNPFTSTSTTSLGTGYGMRSLGAIYLHYYF